MAVQNVYFKICKTNFHFGFKPQLILLSIFYLAVVLTKAHILIIKLLGGNYDTATTIFTLKR